MTGTGEATRAEPRAKPDSPRESRRPRCRQRGARRSRSSDTLAKDPASSRARSHGRLARPERRAGVHGGETDTVCRGGILHVCRRPAQDERLVGRDFEGPEVPSRPKSSRERVRERERLARVDRPPTGAGAGTPEAGTRANVTAASREPRLTTKTLDVKRVPFCPTVFARPGRKSVVARAGRAGTGEDRGNEAGHGGERRARARMARVDGRRSECAKPPLARGSRPAGARG